MINHKRDKGFTLIELLVVIAIIGILASTVLASLSGARLDARDTTRLAQAKELMKALELYRTKNGQYPCSGTANTVDLTCTSAVQNSAKAILSRFTGSAYTGVAASTIPETLLRSTFLSPADDSVGYSLIYTIRNIGGTNKADSSSYTILVGLEDPIPGTTVQQTISGKTLNYCKIVVGSVDAVSSFGTAPLTNFNDPSLGDCPVSGIK